jgi:hypothetical protein
MTIEVVVSNGYVIIDDEDLEKFNEKEWSINKWGYVQSSGRKEKPVLLHRHLLGYHGPLCVDHIDHNPLNNSKSNLRVCTWSENQLNRKGPNKNNTTGYSGVSPYKSGFYAYSYKGGKTTPIGFFTTIEEAVTAKRKYEETGEKSLSKRKGEHSDVNRNLFD